MNALRNDYSRRRFLSTTLMAAGSVLTLGPRFAWAALDHVCIGTDTKLMQPSPRPNGPPPRIGERTNEAWADEKAGFYYTVVDAMLKTGFTPEEIGRIGGGNYLRIFGESTR